MYIFLYKKFLNFIFIILRDWLTTCSALSPSKYVLSWLIHHSQCFSVFFGIELKSLRISLDVFKCQILWSFNLDFISKKEKLPGEKMSGEEGLWNVKRHFRQFLRPMSTHHFWFVTFAKQNTWLYSLASLLTTWSLRTFFLFFQTWNPCWRTKSLTLLKISKFTDRFMRF